MNLGKWGVGYSVNYTNAFYLVNREAFDVSLISLNFSSQALGKEHLRIWIQNDTDKDGMGDEWALAWDGPVCTSDESDTLNASISIFLRRNSGTSRVWIEVNPRSGLSDQSQNLACSGTFYLWFTGEEY